jgi:hypothetical protein
MYNLASNTDARLHAALQAKHYIKSNTGATMHIARHILKTL